MEYIVEINGRNKKVEVVFDANYFLFFLLPIIISDEISPKL
jgi:hypothetical protein